MIDDIKSKIHAHFGPMTTPVLADMLRDPHEVAQGLRHDMDILFPVTQQIHIDALREVMAERMETYIDGLRYTKSAIRETLMKIMKEENQ